MQVKYRISERDYVKASKLFAKFTPKITLAYIAVSIVLIVVAILGSPIFKGAAIGGIIGGSLVCLLGRLIISPIIVKRHYRQYKAMQDEFTVQLLDEGVKFISSSGEGIIVWDNILKWRQNEEYILIYPMPRLYHIVPKSIAENGFDIQQLTESLNTNVGRSV